jgi:glyoxylase-like metal-dependent hydrolase (beta-lactamase superfamily II)
MTVKQITLPGGVRVGVRDWLSANHIFLRGDSGRIIIDTGYVTRAATTLEHVRAAFGVVALDLIVNTHVHSDHMGCNAYLQRWTHAPIAVPAAEAPVIARWDEREMWLSYADQAAERFAPQQLLIAGEIYTWGNLAWRAISTPGHDDGTLVFYNALHRILISADVLWERSFGFVPPRAWDATAMDRARASLDALAALDVAWVIPGHGPPFQDFVGAMQRAYARLAVIENDDIRTARNIAKSMFIYALMARGEMATDALPDYMREVGCMRDLNAQFLKMSDEGMADWISQEAVRSGNARVDGFRLVAVR